MKKLVYGIVAVLMGLGLVLEMQGYHKLSASVAHLVTEGRLPPHLHVSPFRMPARHPITARINGNVVRLPARTFLVPNWSGWITEVPPGNAVQSVQASFRMPPGLFTSVTPESELAMWVGTGGTSGTSYLLQSGAWSYDDLETGGAIPTQGFLEDCSGQASCTAHLSTPDVNLRAGDVVRVSLQFTPLAVNLSWAGFWMDSRIRIQQGGRVVHQFTGRMYLPPWAARPNSVEAVVEDPGTAVSGGAALPNGPWRITVHWRMQLQRAWPTRSWANSHLAKIVATGWQARKGHVTHLTTRPLQITANAEQGSGTVSYNDGVRK